MSRPALYGIRLGLFLTGDKPLIFKYWRMVDVCKKAEDRGASSFMHKPPILYQESLLITSPLFQVVCLAMSLKFDAMEAFIINVCFNPEVKSFI